MHFTVVFVVVVVTDLIKKLTEFIGIHVIFNNNNNKKMLFVAFFSSWATAIIWKTAAYLKSSISLLNTIHCVFISALSGYDMHNASFVNTFMRILSWWLFFCVCCYSLLLSLFHPLFFHSFYLSFFLFFSERFRCAILFLCHFSIKSASKTTKEALETLDFLTYGMKIVSSVHS